MFTKEKFKNPESHFYPGYFWLLDTKMDLAELKGQLRDMAAHGAKSVCLHPCPKRWKSGGWDLGTNLEPDYLTEDWFLYVRELVEECRKLGMNWYLYDEGGFPSGSANGKVWDTDPDRLTRTYAVLDGPDKFKIIREEVNPAGAVLPNLAVPEATQRFIELTHKAYAKYLKPYFGKTIRFTFMDEPVIPAIWYGDRLGWVEDLLPEFQKRKGYDLAPWVPAIIKRGSYGSENFDEAAKVCADYHDVMAQLFFERFLLPIRDWCRENGLLSGGHFGGEDEWFWARHCGYGHLTRSLRGLDMPGVDLIWRQLYPGKRLHPFPKLASSSAHQNGQHATMGELFAVYGSGLQPAVMKYLIDYMLLCGINHFVFSNIGAGQGKDRIAGCRPHFGPIDPMWKYFNVVHSYSARMGYLLSQGKPAADTLLYFDMRPLWTGLNTAEYAICRSLKAADLLLESQRDFDYADDDLILSAVVKDGKLKCGSMTYSTLVIPEDSQLVPATAARVEEFRRAGVRILDIDSIEEAAQTLRVEPATRRLRVSKQIFGKTASYFIFNTSAREVKAKLYFTEKGPVCKADGESAEFYSVPAENGVVAWIFAPWESCCFIVNYKGSVKPLPEKPSAAVRTLDSWTLKPAVQHVVEGKDCRVIPQNADPVKTELGDWSAVLGKTFSGDAVYRTEFTCKDPDKIKFLDLGNVLYSCSVRINGTDAGMKFWGPFVFAVARLLRKGKNVIEITVTNTLANAVSAPGVLESWSGEKHPAGMCKVSHYEPMLRLFEKDSIDSGLFGPVRLMK